MHMRGYDFTSNRQWYCIICTNSHSPQNCHLFYSTCMYPLFKEEINSTRQHWDGEHLKGHGVNNRQ